MRAFALLEAVAHGAARILNDEEGLAKGLTPWVAGMVFGAFLPVLAPLAHSLTVAALMVAALIAVRA